MTPSSNSDAASIADKKKPKYLTKVVKFGKENLTLYSLDGNTWSSRRQELTDIANRHEQERLKSIQAMGENAEREKEEGPPEEEEENESSKEKEDEIDTDVDLDDEELGELDEEDAELLEEVDEAPKKKGAAKGKREAAPAEKIKAKSGAKGASKPGALKAVPSVGKGAPKKKPAKAKK